MQVWMEINVVTFTVMEKALASLNNARVNIIEAKGDSVKDCVYKQKALIDFLNVCVSNK